MPLFTAELDRIANEITSADMVAYAHTAAPTDTDNDNGRINTAGIAVDDANWSTPSDGSGDVTYNAVVNFGVLDAAAQRVVTHWSIFRGTNPVAFGALASSVTVIAGGTFQINTGTIRLLGSTT